MENPTQNDIKNGRLASPSDGETLEDVSSCGHTHYLNVIGKKKANEETSIDVSPEILRPSGNITPAPGTCPVIQPLQEIPIFDSAEEGAQLDSVSVPNDSASVITSQLPGRGATVLPVDDCVIEQNLEDNATVGHCHKSYLSNGPIMHSDAACNEGQIEGCGKILSPAQTVTETEIECASTVCARQLEQTCHLAMEVSESCRVVDQREEVRIDSDCNLVGELCDVTTANSGRDNQDHAIFDIPCDRDFVCSVNCEGLNSNIVENKIHFQSHCSSSTTDSLPCCTTKSPCRHHVSVATSIVDDILQLALKDVLGSIPNIRERKVSTDDTVLDKKLVSESKRDEFVFSERKKEQGKEDLRVLEYRNSYDAVNDPPSETVISDTDGFNQFSEKNHKTNENVVALTSSYFNDSVICLNDNAVFNPDAQVPCGKVNFFSHPNNVLKSVEPIELVCGNHIPNSVNEGELHFKTKVDSLEGSFNQYDDEILKDSCENVKEDLDGGNDSNNVTKHVLTDNDSDKDCELRLSKEDLTLKAKLESSNSCTENGSCVMSNLLLRCPSLKELCASIVGNVEKSFTEEAVLVEGNNLKESVDRNSEIGGNQSESKVPALLEGFNSDINSLNVIRDIKHDENLPYSTNKHFNSNVTKSQSEIDDSVGGICPHSSVNENYNSEVNLICQEILSVDGDMMSSVLVSENLEGEGNAKNTLTHLEEGYVVGDREEGLEGGIENCNSEVNLKFGGNNLGLGDVGDRTSLIPISDDCNSEAVLKIGKNDSDVGDAVSGRTSPVVVSRICNSEVDMKIEKNDSDVGDVVSDRTSPILVSENCNSEENRKIGESDSDVGDVSNRTSPVLVGENCILEMNLKIGESDLDVGDVSDRATPVPVGENCISEVNTKIGGSDSDVGDVSDRISPVLVGENCTSEVNLKIGESYSDVGDVVSGRTSPIFISDNCTSEVNLKIGESDSDLGDVSDRTSPNLVSENCNLEVIPKSGETDSGVVSNSTSPIHVSENCNSELNLRTGESNSGIVSNSTSPVPATENSNSEVNVKIEEGDSSVGDAVGDGLSRINVIQNYNSGVDSKVTKTHSERDQLFTDRTPPSSVSENNTEVLEEICSKSGDALPDSSKKISSDITKNTTSEEESNSDDSEVVYLDSPINDLAKEGLTPSKTSAFVSKPLKLSIPIIPPSVIIEEICEDESTDNQSEMSHTSDSESDLNARNSKLADGISHINYERLREDDSIDRSTLSLYSESEEDNLESESKEDECSMDWLMEDEEYSNSNSDAELIQRVKGKRIKTDRPNEEDKEVKRLEENAAGEKDAVKIVKIENALKSDDLEELRKLARSDGGLINDKLRRKAWPILLGVDQSAAKRRLPPIDMDTMKSHREYNQVVLDVNRSLRRFPSKISQEKRRKLQDDLTEIILRVLMRRPDLYYYQGYHDVAVTTLLVAGKTAAFHILYQISIGHLKDCMLPNMERTTHLLNYIYPLVQRIGPPGVVEKMKRAEVGTIFCLPWFLTWYGYSLSRYEDIVRVFDYFMASPPLAPLYLAAGVVCYRSKEILEAECDHATIHSILSKIPDPLPLENLLQKASEHYELHPPEEVEKDVLVLERELKEKEEKEEERRRELRQRRMLQRRHSMPIMEGGQMQNLYLLAGFNRFFNLLGRHRRLIPTTLVFGIAWYLRYEIYRFL